MRIIAGSLKGRQFDSPDGHRTHPMSEKARGAIFNALGDITGLTLFDAFAGSGAIAFEALSRGAKSALLTDVSKDAHAVMTKNALGLGLAKSAKAVRANASGWSDNNLSAVFDIVVADPPYDDIQMALLTKLEKHIKNKGLYILSLPPDTKYLTDFKLELEKDYGDINLYFYRRI